MVHALQRFLQTGLKKPRAMNIRYRKSVQATSEEFVEFFKSYIKLDVKYNKHNMHLKFTKLNREYEHLTQYKFTTWLNSYASINGYHIEPFKSGNQKFFTITRIKKVTK
jgi:transposase-like protein